VRIGHGEVVAGGAVDVVAELQTHLDADEAFGGVHQLPFLDAVVAWVTCAV
jgi:hypothetical protein